MMKAIVLGIALWIPTGLLAQQPAKRSSSIVGIAMDSLHGGPLRGAEVMVDGANRTVTTDSLGRFRIDSLLPGRYQVGLFHPVLDSLGLTLSTVPFPIGPDSISVIRLAVPSAATLIARNCKARPRALGRSAIFGRLLDPDTFEPILKADVSIVWTEFTISKAEGIHQTPRLIRDSTDSNGVFRLCGLPAELEGRLQANYHGAMTADVPISTAERDGDLVIKPLYVSPSDTGTTKSGKAVVSGRVTLAGGAPATGSRVEIVGSTAVGVTNERGDFTLAGAPSGTQLLLVRHLGYSLATVPVDLSVRQPQRVAVQLQKFISVMDPVLVTARREQALESVGFTLRQKGGFGRYVTADEIARRNPIYLSDVLRTVPGLTLTYRNGQPEIASSRGVGSLTGGACVNYVVDGMRWQSMSPGDVNDFVNPREVAGIEVYQPSETPGEFMDPGMRSCTTIVVWTKFKVGTK